MGAPSHFMLGTVPDWIGAIGTTLALFVAFGVLILDLKERRRRQASAVAAWLERGQDDVILHVVNSSDVPIYDVRIIPKFLGQTYEIISYPLMGSRSDYTPLTLPLPGNQQVSNNYLGVEMLFADSAGRRWKRSINGKLHRRLRRLCLALPSRRPLTVSEI